MFFVHFIDRVFLRFLVDSTKIPSNHVGAHGRKYSNTGHEGTQLTYKDTSFHVNTLFRTFELINFVQNFLQMSER